MRPFLFLSLISACFSPHAAEGVPCDLANPHCPDGQTCQSTGVCSSTELGPIDAAVDVATDAPMVDAGPMDRDGDGVLDEDDNCPDTYNPGQENEDGDQFGDACDPCPIDKNDQPTDDDGDGVANYCDPDDRTPGDKIRLFEGFSHGVPAGWIKTGTWTKVGGDVMANDTDDALVKLGVADPAPGRELVIAGMQMAEANTSNDLQSVGIATSVGADGHGASCGAVRDAGTGVTTIQLFDLFDGNNLATAPLTWAVGDDLAIRITRNGTTYGCEIFDIATGTDANVNATYATHPPNPTVQLFAHQARVRVSWLLVVSSP